MILIKLHALLILNEQVFYRRIVTDFNQKKGNGYVGNKLNAKTVTKINDIKLMAFCR